MPHVYRKDIPLESGLKFGRGEDGRVWVNVPWLVKDHSPDGFEFGYGGSGPADLALNALQAFLQLLGYRGELTGPLWDGNKVYELAWRLHQQFKWDFIAAVGHGPGSNGPIGFEYPLNTIMFWIEANWPEGIERVELRMPHEG